MDNKTGIEDTFLGGPEWVSTITENEAQERIDIAVSPKDRKWIETHQAFHKLLADTEMTIGQILSANFTQHETHLFILSQSAVLRTIQEDNTRRFYSLLQGRFQGVTPDIPSKLTMLYFGLPIEPMDFPLAAMNSAIEIRKPEPPRYAADPPLHFLTAHKERNWGDEALMGEFGIRKEDPAYPVPVKPPQNWLSSLSHDYLRDQLTREEECLQDEQPVLRLRGGGADDDSDWSEKNDSDPSYSESDEEDGSEDGGDEVDALNEGNSRRKDKKTIEADDVTMDEIDNGGDCGDSSLNEETTPSPQSSKWTNLYGFQGCLPFIPGNRQTYESAIRRLLSLGPRDGKAFSIVHFDENSNQVDTIHDSLPLKRGSATLEYVSEKSLKGRGNPPQPQPSFFVKLKNEAAPEHWQPSEEKFRTSVSSVRWAPDGEQGAQQQTDGPVSCCYLTFPRANDSQLSLEEVCGWGADQYNAYVRTALEVLLGLPEGPFHHAFFRLGKGNSDLKNAPPAYGFSSISSSDILSLIPSGDGKPSALSCSQLDGNEVAFVLPCYYYNDDDAPLDWSGKNTITKTSSFIQQMVSTAFGDSAKHLNYVRLLDGRATLGPEINRNQKYYSIRMSDDLPQNSEVGYASALSKIISHGNPFVLLYPEWGEDQTFLCLQVTNGDDGAEYYVHMPPLSSTVKEFRASVFELMQLAGFEKSRTLDVDSGKASISIQPRIGEEPANVKVDAPCFFISPNTTDEEWFSIRARITTPLATVKILDSKAWDWRVQAQNTDIWGPRYGHMAETQTVVEKSEEKKTRKEAKNKTTRERVISSTMREDAPTAEPTEVSRFDDWAQKQPYGKDVARDSERRRRTWAAQPSIFENYGLLPWPANSGIRFPMNAPPSEHMLRTGPRMPMVSKAILTPTEQGELQRIAWDLRNLCLNRTMECAYDGCRFTYRLDDQQAMRKHLQECHTARKCMWCDEILFAQRDAKGINRHMREKHKDMLMEALGVSRATIRRFDGEGTISIPLKRARRPHTHSPLGLASDDMIIDTPKSQEPRRDKTPGFCDRCGREASYSNKNEQAYHDSHCKPGIFNGAECKFCTACGKHVWLSATDAKRSGKSNGQLAHCSHNVDDANGPHCSLCGFDMSRLPQDGRDQHQKRCKGFSALSGRFCLYCGEEFRDVATQADWNRNKAHMIACYEENAGAMSLLQAPDVAAFQQQQNNLRGQIIATKLGAVDSEEREQGPREQDDLSDSDEEPRQTKPARKRLKMGWPRRARNGSSSDGVSTALRAMEGAVVGLETPHSQSPNPDAHRYNQEALRAILLRNISNGTFETPTTAPRKSPDNTSQRKIPSRSPSRPPSPDPLAGETEKDASEPEIQKAEHISSQDADSSESDLDDGSDFGEGGEQDAQQSGDDKESEDELQGDPTGSKRRGRGGRKRGRKGDRNYEAESEDDDDSESDEDGQSSKPPRRSPSPNWNRLLGPEDAQFEPSEEYYCSKCFRKAPKKHNRDRSPLGRGKEIELHHDPSRCCGIRRGIGSTKRLPNRSGWIPSSLMPKPLTNLRKAFLRRYPTYARTVYPLSASNANGSYYRSDPNNDDNKDWWSIPWPPFRGPSPLPNGWVAPDVVDVPSAGRGRQQFQLKPVPDPTYRQGNDAHDSEDDDVASDRDTNGKRKRRSRPPSAFSSAKARTAPTVAKRSQKKKITTKADSAAVPRSAKKKGPMLQRMAKARVATSRKVTQQTTEKTAPVRRSTRKRQKTG
ncbi:hypothetical protein Trco_002419 [Trichoderma cornu-damae]|uniref:Uncharacterized protein n=1 Tax=Trichoderma cornu-damae TaxID=654480 RepID=A0A9P8QUM8_9HYPO|nr:hypothetical protein Trco_002419 [Trichoderma cornu-damae]